METFSYLCNINIILNQEARFKVAYMEEALDFLNQLPQKVQAKVMYTIGKSMYVLDNNLFKKLGDTEIWEFRTLYNGMAYRLFAFWDTEAETLVIATHGISKKTRRTPQKEIAKAEVKREEYFKNKNR